MITLKFSKNSWHYKFIASMKETHYISDNICGYFWDFFFCCVTAALIFFGTVIALYVMVVAPLMWLWVIIQFGYLQPHTEAGVGVIADIVALLIAGLFYLVEVWIPARAEKKRREEYEARKNGEYKPRQDSFVKAVWNKFHDKTCAKIEFGE